MGHGESATSPGRLGRVQVFRPGLPHAAGDSDRAAKDSGPWTKDSTDATHATIDGAAWCAAGGGHAGEAPGDDPGPRSRGRPLRGPDPRRPGAGAARLGDRAIPAWARAFGRGDRRADPGAPG